MVPKNPKQTTEGTGVSIFWSRLKMTLLSWNVFHCWWRASWLTRTIQTFTNEKSPQCCWIARHRVGLVTSFAHLVQRITRARSSVFKRGAIFAVCRVIAVKVSYFEKVENPKVLIKPREITRERAHSVPPYVAAYKLIAYPYLQRVTRRTHKYTYADVILTATTTTTTIIILKIKPANKFYARMTATPYCTVRVCVCVCVCYGIPQPTPSRARVLHHNIVRTYYV